jgi:hypothetical protein
MAEMYPGQADLLGYTSEELTAADFMTISHPDQIAQALCGSGVTADRLSDGDRNDLAESIALAEQSMMEIRTVSYLLHPPFSR